MEFSAAAKSVEQYVRAAFGGVTLGCGIGLREADACDDGMTPEGRSAVRMEDEKLSWSLISFEDLHRHGQFGWAYLDAESLRFHLPAFILADIYDESDGDLPRRLIEPSPQRDRLYSILNADQRMAVRKFLLFALTDSFYDSEHELIRQGLEGCWSPNRINDG
jgi:hypothetical protein